MRNTEMSLRSVTDDLLKERELGGVFTFKKYFNFCYLSQD